MPIWHDEYRGYRISYQGDRRSIIATSDSETPLEAKAEAGPGEGRIELRHKAHAIIDSDIAANRAS